MNDSVPEDRRGFGFFVLGVGVVVVIIVTLLVLFQSQWAVIAYVFAIPNFYAGIRAIRSSRRP